MVLTLLTDFGLSDVYVGVMKGTIAQINPRLPVIDLTHQIPPQDIAIARFHLMTAYPYFPRGTVHVAVVDPGVGSARRAIAIQLEAGFLVGPDNGIFSGVLSQHRAIAAVELTNPHYWHTIHPSVTFHGRDIFAPVGAHLGTGVLLSKLGDAIDLTSLTPLPFHNAIRTETGFQGVIQAIDHFGNLVTNISGDEIHSPWSIEIQGQTYPGRKTYAETNPGEVLGLIGSHGWIEIAVNGGNAQKVLGLEIESEISVLT
jgi:S-adenosyl-L-methionine hydrolase (adenosine-forming)